ncbi:MAG: hypothetical protein WCO84_03915 [bacterium]
MLQIGTLLERFKRFSKPDILVREKTCQIIEEELGIKLDDKKISFKNGTICVSTYNHVLKSEIFIKKGRILRRIQDSMADKNILDIR